VNAKNVQQQDTADASDSGAPTAATDVAHLESVHTVLQQTRSISSMATAEVAGISPPSALHILTEHLGKWSVEQIPYMSNDDQHALCMFLSTTHF
jgi:hypothetical protein